MVAVLFDTLKMVETLEAGGFTGQQARAMTAALGDAATVADVATRGDLMDMGLGLKHDIDAVRTDLVSLEQRMTIRMGSMLVVLAGLLSAEFHYLR